MYSQDHFTDEDRAVLCDGCEIECKFNKNGGTNDKHGILDEIKSLAMQHSGLTEFNSGYKNAVNDIISLIAPIFEEPRFKYNENGYSRFENKLIEFRNNTPLISVNYRQGKGIEVIKRYAYELLQIAKESIMEEPASRVWHDATEEKPMNGSRVLTVQKDNCLPSLCFYDSTKDVYGISHTSQNLSVYPSKWAYVDDLLNLTHLVTKKSDQEEILILKDQIESCHAAMKCKDELLEIKQKQLMDKMCEWLKKNFNMPNDFENHFRKAMEEKYECGV